MGRSALKSIPRIDFFTLELRKAKSVEELLPRLYLKGVSTGDFSEALAALLTPNAKGLSAKTITRLKADWWSEYESWEKRTSAPDGFSTSGPTASASSRGWLRSEEDQKSIRGIDFPTNNAFW